MSMNWCVPFGTQAKSGVSWLRRLGAAVERYWIGYCRRRIEELAISQLRAMSDRELKDIGLLRSEIGMAVRFEPLADRCGGDQLHTKWRGVIHRVR